jgi:hypothetical protein
MNAIARFLSLGMQDADRRLAAALAPPPLDAADRYVKDSAAVRAIDRVTRLLPAWWESSTAGRTLAGARDVFLRSPRSARYREIGSIVLTAAIVHVVLTIAQGPRPGWFWTVIPGMAVVFAMLLLAASREPED